MTIPPTEEVTDKDRQRLAELEVELDYDALKEKLGLAFAATSGHNQREQTLNALLVEMDGTDKRDGLIVIGATNRVDMLDPAVTRAGRFDYQIHLGLPDLEGLECPWLQTWTSRSSLAEKAGFINGKPAPVEDQLITRQDFEAARASIEFGDARLSRATDDGSQILGPVRIQFQTHGANHQKALASLREHDRACYGDPSPQQTRECSPA